MKKQGISLITLVITIVLIIILAGAVILNLADNNPIKSAKKATVFQDIDTFKTELMLKMTTGYTNGIFDTDNINAVTKEDILKYIPSMKNEKVGGTLYADILVVSEGTLAVDGTKASEAIANGKLTQEQYEWILEALGNNVFNAETYIVKYYLNDGTEEYKESSKIHGVTYSVLPIEITRDGYGFKNWNTNQDGTGVTYNVGDEYTLNEDLTLYAQWEAGTYTITYYKNDGTEEAKTATKSQDVPYEITDQNFTRNGYTFVGYNTSTDGTGIDYIVGSSYSENAELELYAKWEIITYNITYYKNDGTNGNTVDVKTHGISYTVATKGYTRNGYTFVGYNTSTDGTGIDYIVGSSYSENAELELYAKWEIITYNITYYKNDGTNGNTVDVKTHGISYTVATKGYTRDGYTFDGWNTNSSGTGTDYAVGTEYVINAELELYAKWKADKYAVTYDANGGTNAPANQLKIYGVTLTLSSSMPTRTGYTFDGWNTKSDGTGTNYAKGASYTLNEPLELYAKWKQNIVVGSAQEVKSNASAYYGAYVNYAPRTGDGKWRVFLADSTNIYLIAEDYVSNYILTPELNSSEEEGEYQYYCVYSNISRQILVSSMGSSYYTNFKDFAGKAESVVGGPTLEQFVESYNAVNTDTIDIHYYSAKGETYGGYTSKAPGYALKFSNVTNYGNSLTIPSTANKLDLYVRPYGIYADGMWLASFSATGTSSVFKVDGNRSVGFRHYSYTYYGLRPLVKLNSGVKLIDPDGDGVYDLE